MKKNYFSPSNKNREKYSFYSSLLNSYSLNLWKNSDAISDFLDVVIEIEIETTKMEECHPGEEMKNVCWIIYSYLEQEETKPNMVS